MMEIELPNGLKIKGNSDEMSELIDKLMTPFPGPTSTDENIDRSDPIVTSGMYSPEPKPEVSITGQVARTIEHKSYDRNSWGINVDSAYMRRPGRRYKQIAAVYDHIAEHKRGRTTQQLVERFRTPKATMWSRLATLEKEGLIYQPGKRGSAWIAVPESLIEEPQPVQNELSLNIPTPAVMPRHLDIERRA